MWVAFGGNTTREDFGMLVGEITDDEKKKADEEIREQQKQIDYDTKDYTIELLVQKFEKNDFFIPDYQRALMWGNANKNLFILHYSIFLANCVWNKKYH